MEAAEAPCALPAARAAWGRTRLAMMTVRSFGRAGASLLLYLLISIAILWPHRSAQFRPAADLEFAIALSVEAGNALREGQFPIRVAPRQHDGLRYPIFQYYGNFPYTVTGLLCLAGIDPYSAWKLVTLAALICGAYFTQRSAYLLSRRHLAAVIGGCVFLTAPYLLTDVNARGAFSEYTAFCLLPAALYFTLRRAISRRKRYLFACAITWTLVGLSHNIAYLYGVLFIGLFIFSLLRWNRKLLPRLGRLAIAGILHGVLIAWYFAPQWYSVRLLSLNEVKSTDVAWSALVLNPIRILLAPTLSSTADGSVTPGLGLQVGMPILAAAALAMAALCLPRVPRGRKAALVRLTALLCVALFMAWTPFNFWRHLPRTLWFVQLPYRLLMFVVLWGSLLAACALATCFPRMSSRTAVVCLLLLGAAASSYVPRAVPLQPDLVRQEMVHPDVGVAALVGYLLSPTAIANTSWSNVNPDFTNWKVRLEQIQAQPFAVEQELPVAAVKSMRIGFGGKARCLFQASSRTLLELPVLYYPQTVDVRDNDKPVQYGNIGRFVTIRLEPGVHRITERYVGVAWANLLSGIAWIGILLVAIIAGLWRLARRLDMRLPRDGGRRACRNRAPQSHPLSPANAVVAFLALTTGSAVPLMHPLARLLDHGPRLRIHASSQAARETAGEMAFDHDYQTAWVAADSGPAVLTIDADRDAVLKRIVLVPRPRIMFEAWRHVRIVLFLKGRKVYEKDLDIENAAHRAVQSICLRSTRTDRVELHFSVPVTEPRDPWNATPDLIQPGYQEIQLIWAG